MCSENQTIAIEDIAIGNLNRKQGRHSKSFHRMGVGMFLQKLKSKALEYGTEIVVASRNFPSTKMCSNCDNIIPKISIKTRTYNCEKCGFSIDRDLNAAINLKNVALKEKEKNTSSVGEDYDRRESVSRFDVTFDYVNSQYKRNFRRSDVTTNIYPVTNYDTSGEPIR